MTSQNKPKIVVPKIDMYLKITEGNIGKIIEHGLSMDPDKTTLRDQEIQRKEDLKIGKFCVIKPFQNRYYFSSIQEHVSAILLNRNQGVTAQVLAITSDCILRKDWDQYIEVLAKNDLLLGWITEFMKANKFGFNFKKVS